MPRVKRHYECPNCGATGRTLKKLSGYATWFYVAIGFIVVWMALIWVLLLNFSLKRGNPGKMINLSFGTAVIIGAAITLMRPYANLGGSSLYSECNWTGPVSMTRFD